NSNLFFKGFSGNGEILRPKRIKNGSQTNTTDFSLDKEETNKEDKTVTFSKMSVGIIIAGGFFFIGSIIGNFTPIHPYAWTIIIVILFKGFNLIPDFMRKAANVWFSFVSKEWTWALLAASGASAIDI